MTDRRVLFLAAPGAGPEGGEDAGSLAYADLAAVDVEDGSVVEFAGTEGVAWRVPLPEGEDAVEAVLRHLRWIGRVRSRLVSTRNDVELAAGEIGSHAEAMAWEDAAAVYEDARASLDRAIDAVLATEPIEPDVLAPELTDVEHRLESAYASALLERASSQLTLGQQLVENEDYGQARSVLERAQSHFHHARDHAEAVERGDDFRFGEQRELDQRLERMAWEIEAVAAEPIRQAHEAKILAEDADEPDAAVQHWERAFRRYGHVLSLELGEGERHFAGDRAAVREALETAAGRLVDRHRELARERWNEGVSSHEAGDVKPALTRYGEAEEHLERAHELAAEFEAGVAPKLAERLERVRDELAAVRETATVETPPEGSEADEAPADSESGAAEGESADGQPRHTVEELRNLDTATEVTLGAEPERLEVPDPEGETVGAPMEDRGGDGTRDPESVRAGPDGDDERSEVVVEADGTEEE